MSYEPELYDVVTRESFLGDRDWYRRKAKECGGPVLELGAGTGRITLGIAKDGIRIHALDADASMLNALRRKVAAESREVQERVAVIDSDMRVFHCYAASRIRR